MTSTLHPALLFALLAACTAALAQVPAPSAPASAAPATKAEAKVVSVVEDDNVRIEETRVRGQLQRVTVQSKIVGVRPYEIIVGPGGRDPSRDRGTAGQSAWSLFSF